MNKNIIGIFATRKEAEEVINKIHNEYSIDHDNISYLYKNTEGETKEKATSDLESSETVDSAKKGATAGGVIGALAGLAAVAGIVPVVGPIFAAGSLVTALGITGGVGVTAAGAVTGAAAGGLVGALVGMGAEKEKAIHYEDQVTAGNILVVVQSEDDMKVKKTMDKGGALETEVYTVTV